MASLTARELKERVRAKADAGRKIREAEAEAARRAREAVVLKLAGVMSRREEVSRLLLVLEREAGDVVQEAAGVMPLSELADYIDISVAELRRLPRSEPEPEPAGPGAPAARGGRALRVRVW